jgi:DNA-binding MarR family transcriptional regulator
VVTATYIVKVTTNDRIADDAASVDRYPPPDGRAALLREISEGVAALSSRHRCAAARRVHHSGISLGHLQVLWILQEHGPLPVSRLADWLGIGVPNATGLLDRMEQRGLVERARDAGDRRVVLARQTDLGREAVAELDGWRAGLVEQVLATDQLALIAAGLRDAATTIPAYPALPADAPDDAASPRRSAVPTHAAVPANADVPPDGAPRRGDVRP